MIYDSNNATKLIKKIQRLQKEFKLSVTRNKSLDATSPCGAAYNVKIVCNNNRFVTQYYNSRSEKENKPNPDWILECLFRDAQAYKENPEFPNFCYEFGYDQFEGTTYKTNEAAWKAYNGCKKTEESLSKMFNESQMNKIMNWIYEMYK